MNNKLPLILGCLSLVALAFSVYPPTSSTDHDSNNFTILKELLDFPIVDNAYAGGNTSTEPKTTTPPDISCGDELYCPSTSTCGSVACVNPDGDIVGIIGCCVASGEDVLDKCPCLPGTTPAVE